MTMLAAVLLAQGAAAAAKPAVAPPPPAVEPVRAATAARVAARLMPDGTYRTMMRDMTDQIVGMFGSEVTDIPIKEFVRAAGVGEAEVAKLGKATITDIMAILDPAYRQRSEIGMRVMIEEIGTLMTTLEPEYRAGLAAALAARFDGAQLAELDRFFATPVGSAYAAQSLSLYTDPAMMQRMRAMTPRLIEAMPAIVAKTIKATEGLPKARDVESLTKEEREKLMLLLGVEDSK